MLGVDAANRWLKLLQVIACVKANGFFQWRSFEPTSPVACRGGVTSANATTCT